MPASLPPGRPAERYRGIVTDLENRLPPRAFLDRIAAEAADGDPGLAAALAATPVAAELGAAERIADFAARPLAEDAILCHSGRPPAGRRLLIGFTGTARRLMLPTAAFLQRMDPARWDVLLLCDSGKSHYREGSRGLAPTFPALAGWLEAFAAPYLAVTALGTSMGGFAAIRFALRCDRARGISIGGRPAQDILRIFARDRPFPAFDPICACLDPAGRRAQDLVYVFPAENAPDATAARAAAGLSGGALRPVAGVQNHALLAVLWQEGRLGSFLDRVLDPGLPPAAMAAGWE